MSTVLFNISELFFQHKCVYQSLKPVLNHKGQNLFRLLESPRLGGNYPLTAQYTGLSEIL